MAIENGYDEAMEHSLEETFGKPVEEEQAAHEDEADKPMEEKSNAGCDSRWTFDFDFIELVLLTSGMMKELKKAVNDPKYLGNMLEPIGIRSIHTMSGLLLKLMLALHAAAHEGDKNA